MCKECLVLGAIMTAGGKVEKNKLETKAETLLCH